MIFIALTILTLFLIWYAAKLRREYFSEWDPTVVRLKYKLSATFPQLLKLRIAKSDASYTIDKKRIYLCTERDGVTYDDNMMTYVLLHELAHTLTAEIGHGREFGAIFRGLLRKAAENGLYDPNEPKVKNYCGSSSTVVARRTSPVSDE